MTGLTLAEVEKSKIKMNIVKLNSSCDQPMQTKLGVDKYMHKPTIVYDNVNIMHATKNSDFCSSVKSLFPVKFEPFKQTRVTKIYYTAYRLKLYTKQVIL